MHCSPAVQSVARLQLTVGDGVGLAVGRAVGAGVGAGVGCGLGAGVGAGVVTQEKAPTRTPLAHTSCPLPESVCVAAQVGVHVAFSASSPPEHAVAAGTAGSSHIRRAAALHVRSVQQ